MRLDRFISQATGLTRSQAQRAVRAGHVCVNGEVARDGGMHVDPTARVDYRDETLSIPGPCYLMLHKPAGYVCATRDGGHRTVLELLDVPNRANLHIAGRLDIDATGLVLLTDDGAWSHRIMSPRHKVPKIYRVTLAEPLSEQGAQSIQRGIQLKDEPDPCAPAQVERLSDTEVRIVIIEGKYHQVKRMFAAVGNHVVALHRERIGVVTLDIALAPGESRPLTEGEVASFRSRGSGS